MKLEYCYHSHTTRCGHAYGEDEEYVISAIKLGIKRLGFSDHVFLPHIHQPYMRGEMEMMSDYLKSVHFLKEKYQDQIDIHVGFEAEYSKQFESYYRDLLESHKVEYLILGQHCRFDKQGCLWYFYRNAPVDSAIKYTDDLVAGIESGLFTYVCHPDLFVNCYHEWTSELEHCAKRIFEAAEKYHVPLEINLGGIRNVRHSSGPYQYPCKEFWKHAKDYDVEIVIGVDAHSPTNYNENDIQEALDFAKELNLKVNFDFDPFK